MNYQKKSVLIICSLLFCWHFFATIIYISEGRFTVSWLNKAVAYYMVPLFHQDWKVFAPEPPLSQIWLYYRVKDNEKGWSKWKDAAKPFLKKHHANRFSSNGKLYKIQDIVARDLYELHPMLSKDSISMTSVKQSWQYKNAVRYYKQRILSDYPSWEVSTLEFAYVSQSFNTMKDRMNSIQKPKMILRFPPYEMDI